MTDSPYIDDNGFFGEFYTGTAGRIVFSGLDSAAQPGLYTCASGAPCAALVNTATAIPSGAGSFTSFGATAVSGNLTTFIGTGAGQSGVYGCDSRIPVDPCRALANLNTAIPGGTGAFTGFEALAVTTQHTAFLGLGASGVRRAFIWPACWASSLP